MKTLNDLFYDVILLNELGGDASAALRFSDAGIARSGYSFGLTQMDVRNNPRAVCCLVDCGFTQDEIHGLIDETCNPIPLSARLVAHKDTIERYDEAQLSHCLNKALEFNISHNIIMVDETALLAVADYVNQYGSEGDGIAAFFEQINIGRPVVGQDVQDFKLNHTKYGQEHPKDCIRRYNNILEIVERNK